MFANVWGNQLSSATDGHSEAASHGHLRAAMPGHLKSALQHNGIFRVTTPQLLEPRVR